MWPWKKKQAPESDKPGPERRRSERFQTAVLSFDLGPIVDVSRHGLRVQVQRNPGLGAGTEFDLELCAPTDGMTVRAQVIRVMNVGGGRYEIAMAFLNVGEEQRGAIENLARTGRRKAAGAFSNNEQREKLVAALKLPDYYEALGLGSGATGEEIQAAYRLMARRYHPDVCREAGAQERFCLINEAHSTLLDEKGRREYDALYALRKAA